MDPWQLIPPDPEEEERQRIAALGALAAAGQPDREAPVLLPDPVQPIPADPIELGQLTITAGADLGPERSPFSMPDPQMEGTAHALGTGTLEPDPRGFGQQLDAVSAPSPGRVQPLAAAVEPAPPAQQDPFEALMRRGEEQRQRALELYGENEPGINGWALLADVAFNKGRSIPQMLQQVDNDKRAWRDARAKLLTQGHSDPVNQAIALGNLRERQGTGERLRNKEALAAEQDASARAAFMSSWGKYMTPEEQEAFANAPAATFRTMANQIRDRIKNSPEYQQEHARGVGMDAAARTHETNVTNRNDSTIRAETSGEAAGAVAAAQAPHLANKPLTPNEQLTQERLARIEQGNEEQRRLDNERRAREEVEKKEGKDRDWQTTFANRNKIPLQMARELESIEKMDEANQKAGKPTPGIDRSMGGGLANEVAGSPLTPNAIRGLVGDYGPDEAKITAGQADRITNLLLGFEVDVIKNQSGSAYNVTEEQKNKIRVGASPTASGPQKREALRVMHEIIETNIGTQASANPEIAERAMIGGGITPERFGSARWRAARGGPTMPTAIDPELAPGQSLTTNEEGEEVVEGAGVEPEFSAAKPPASRKHKPRAPSATNLGVTPGTPPKVNAGGTREVTIVYTDGTSETAELDDMQIAKLRGKRSVKEIR